MIQFRLYQQNPYSILIYNLYNKTTVLKFNLKDYQSNSSRASIMIYSFDFEEKELGRLAESFLKPYKTNQVFQVQFSYTYGFDNQDWHINPVGHIEIISIENKETFIIQRVCELTDEFKLNLTLAAYEYLQKNKLLPYHNIIPLYQYGVRFSNPHHIKNIQKAKVIPFKK